MWDDESLFTKLAGFDSEETDKILEKFLYYISGNKKFIINNPTVGSIYMSIKYLVEKYDATELRSNSSIKAIFHSLGENNSLDQDFIKLVNIYNKKLN